MVNLAVMLLTQKNERGGWLFSLDAVSQLEPNTVKVEVSK